MALHPAIAIARLPASAPTWGGLLPVVVRLCSFAWSEKSCLLRLHFHINCPPACMERGKGWMGSFHGEEERGVRLGGAQPELLIPDFPEIKVCISCARVAVMRSLHCYRGKDMHRFTLQPLRFLGRPPSLPSLMYLPSSSVGGNQPLCQPMYHCPVQVNVERRGLKHHNL